MYLTPGCGDVVRGLRWKRGEGAAGGSRRARGVNLVVTAAMALSCVKVFSNALRLRRATLD
jgi:hypothetical protein